MLLTYAIGDIHGSLEKLRELIGKCRQHAGGRPVTFVFLGDYIDRGPDSRGVVRTVMQLQSEQGGGVIALKGNHEAVALDIVDGKAEADHWLQEGGAATLRNYGVASAQELPRQHTDWMRSLPLSHDDGRRFFVHAGIDPEKPFDRQSDHDLIWIREPFLSDGRDYGRLIVHGHTPVARRVPDQRRNRLNIDTGAVYGGPLTAAVFDDAQNDPVAFLQAE
jgi:serine/threonine protein phosphatase 1